MYLLYYINNGNKGWIKCENKETLQQWADKNLGTKEMSADDDYEIVDLSNKDLQNELKECRNKLKTIRELVK